MKLLPVLRPIAVPVSSSRRSSMASKTPVRTEATFRWGHGGSSFEIPYDVTGEGKQKILCLPSINLGSTRKELRPVTQLLAPSLTSVVCDWPGFGDASRPNAAYSPAMLLSFVRAFVEEVFERNDIPVVASGHACAYVLKLAEYQPSMFSQIVLISPTYRSPAKAMGMHPFVAWLVRAAFKSPFLGEMLYGRVTQPSFLKKQYASHVFKDPTKLTDAFIQEKHEIVNKAGGRFGPASFFTGQLDVIQSREELMELMKSVKCPLKVIYGESSPTNSLAEMQALGESEDLDVVPIVGSLGVVEEFPEEVSKLVIPFLSKS